MSFDTISDMFCSLNNAKEVKKPSITFPFSKFKEKILELLKKEKVISDFKVYEENKKKFITVSIIYIKNIPTFKKISRVSKSSLRVYKKNLELAKDKSKTFFYIVSTSKLGVISDNTAIENKIGGEIVGKVI